MSNKLTLEQSKQLHESGLKPKNLTHYWVDLSAWRKGIELMPKEEAEHRCEDSKFESFTDYPSTIPSFNTEDWHLSDCSVHNEPCYPIGECDCLNNGG